MPKQATASQKLSIVKIQSDDSRVLSGYHGMKIRATDGIEETGFPEIMSLLTHIEAYPGDTLVLRDKTYKFNVATYAPEINPQWIYTYSYAPDQCWAAYRNDLVGNNYSQDDYIFSSHVYFRVCLRKISGDEFDGNEDINDIIQFIPSNENKQNIQGLKAWIAEEVNRVSNRINSLRTKDDAVFVLMSDTHYVTNGTWKDTMQALTLLNKKAQFDGIIHLGDLTDGMVTKKAARQYAEGVLSDINSIGAPLWLAIGNHDTNYFRNNPQQLTQNEQSELYYNGGEIRHFTDLQNLRLIFIDAFDPAEKQRYGFNNECIEWLAQTLESMQNNQKALIFCHLPPATKLQFWVKSLRGEAGIQSVLEQYSHKILAWVNGHNHADIIDNSGFVPVVSIANAKCEAFTEHKPEGFITPERELNHATQELWDVMLVDKKHESVRFIRFGAGMDRVIQNKKVSWVSDTNLEVWAHRGVSYVAPENTLPAFELASEKGAYGVEMDIQLTKDGEIVVIHDETVNRTCNGSGYVKNFTLAEIKTLNANKNGKHVSIPTLAEVFECIKPTNLKLNIELKTGVIPYDGIEQKALELARVHGMTDRIVWSSFNHFSVQKIKQLCPDADTALLSGGGIHITARQCKAVGASALHADITQLNNSDIIEDCQKHGIKLRIWTIDDYPHYQEAINKGVDGIFSNKVTIFQNNRSIGINRKSNKLTDLQAVELDILKEFKRVADAENLCWFVMFGTLLGASRYSGFIPWDNDIDVALPRDDYNKLRALAHLFKEPYFLQTPANDPAASPRFTKLRRSDTTVIEKSSFPNAYTKGGHMGVSIDIFPLDTVPDQPTARALQRMAQTINRQMYASAALDENDGEDVPDIKENDCIADGGIVGHYNFFAEQYEKCCSKYKDGHYYALPTLAGARGCCMFDKKWFDESVLMDFEGLKIPAPPGWEKVLVASYPEGLYEPLARYQKPKYGKAYIVDTARSYKEYTKRWTDMLADIENKNVYIFGAGDSLRIWLERYGSGLNVVCAFDNSESKWGLTAYGVTIRDPKGVSELVTTRDRLIIASIYHEEIGKQLEKQGFDDYFVFIDGLKYSR